MAWTLTNTGSGNSIPTRTAVAASAFGASLTNPSLIIAVVGCASGTTVMSVTDTAGNTYVDSGAGKATFNGSVSGIQIFYALNTSTTASNIVTLNLSPTTGFGTIFVQEWTGGATSSPVDVFQSIANQLSVAGGANALVITSQTTTLNGDLIIAGFGTITNNSTAGTSPNAFTVVGTPINGIMMETFVQTTAGAIGPTAGDITVDHWGGVMAAFKLAPAAGVGFGYSINRRLEQLYM